MTRINCGIPPSELCREHLLAEHREIIRIPNVIKTNKAVISNIPDKFKLGTGHVKFFYNKISYLEERYNQIFQQCIERKYKVQDYSNAFKDIPVELNNNYVPTQDDIDIVKTRILERSNCLSWEDYQQKRLNEIK